jgi:hypothetical protein
MVRHALHPPVQKAPQQVRQSRSTKFFSFFDLQISRKLVVSFYGITFQILNLLQNGLTFHYFLDAAFNFLEQLKLGFE